MEMPEINENFNEKPTINGRIFCYTGTGNSFAAAKQISKYFGGLKIDFITEELCLRVAASQTIDYIKEHTNPKSSDDKLPHNSHCTNDDFLIELQSVNKYPEQSAKPLKIECEFAVIVLPSYGFGLPKLVKRFIKNTDFNVGYLAVAVLQGSSQRGTTAEAVKILKKKGQLVHHSSGVNSVENYVHLFGHPKLEMQKQRSNIQQQDVELLCKAYESRKENKVRLFRPLSAFVSFIFKIGAPIFAKCYKITKECNSCEICRKVCPPNAITMKQEKGRTLPKFKASKCDHCQACLQLCPKKAIKFFRIKPKSPRYIHRDVSLGELIKRD